MAVLINGNGNEAIYAQQDADWYAALMGGVTMITAVGEQFAYELLDANTIGVKDGVIITKEGRRIQVDTNVIDTFDIPTGAQGTTNYYIIGYHLVTDEQSVQTAETFVQLMENGTDTIPEGSFKEGDDDVYVSLYRVEQNDLTIGTITLLLPTVSDSMQQQISQINNDLSELKTYSSNETLVGYDSDGSPIYRRTFYADYDTVITATNGTKDTVLTTAINTSNVKRVVSLSGAYFNNGVWNEMPLDHTEYNGAVSSIALRLGSSNFYLHMYSASGSLTIHAYRATIEYVKN